jgi:hypothetical protein
MEAPPVKETVCPILIASAANPGPENTDNPTVTTLTTAKALIVFQEIFFIIPHNSFYKFMGKF